MKSTKICIVSTSARMLWVFYRDLIKTCKDEFCNVTVVTSDMQELDNLTKYSNCNCLKVGIKRNITIIDDIKCIFKLYRYFSQNKFKIIHSHTPKGGLVAMISAYLAKVPIRIYTAHGLPIETAKGLKKILLKMADKVTCKCANHVLAVSPSLKEAMIKNRVCKRSKIKVLADGSACGVNLNYFNDDENFKNYRNEMRNKLGIDEGTVIFGFVGRLGPEKGANELIEAFIRLKKIRNVFLLIVGEPETLHGNLNNKINDIINSKSEIFFENKHIENIKQYYAAMDVVVLPSWREGFGMSLAEAGALGIPTIASDATGCKDIIDDNNTGLLFQMKNSDELFSRMLKFCDNPDLRLLFGNNAKQRIKKYFDSKNLINEHLKFYESLLNEY